MAKYYLILGSLQGLCTNPVAFLGLLFDLQIHPRPPSLFKPLPQLAAILKCVGVEGGVAGKGQDGGSW